MSLVSINDVLKITTKVEKIHPYKVVGDRDSYSPYNEGWSDCVSLIEHYLEQLPSAEPKIIRCCDCKWWDRLEEGHPYGYCLACRSGTHTERWDISIYRQCKFDFFCADAEPREDEEVEGE